uniref:hypothetical protein n=1 Tax=Luteitalea sp. TaxID=2004800 RepID=UPI0025BBEC9B
MVNLLDIRTTLETQVAAAGNLPCHVAAFCTWILGDNEGLHRHVLDAVSTAAPGRRPDHVAALGYGAAAGILTDDQRDL